jgi:hypothetical protein
MAVPRAWLPAGAVALPPSAGVEAVALPSSAGVAVVALPPSAGVEVVVPRPSAAEVQEQPVWVEGAVASVWLPAAAEAMTSSVLEAPGVQHWFPAQHRR